MEERDDFNEFSEETDILGNPKKPIVPLHDDDDDANAIIADDDDDLFGAMGASLDSEYGDSY